MENRNALVQTHLLLFLTAVLVLAGCVSPEMKPQTELSNSVATSVITDDDRKLFESIKVKAEAGDAEAQWNLGYYYAIGKGVVKNERESEKWYRKSAEQGDALAQANLGAIYFDGVGVKKDYYEAFKWFRKAAEQGSDFAQLYLGGIYYKGLGATEKDNDQAAKWLRRAAEQGNAKAQGMLGEFYFNGEGVSQNYIEAYKWFNLSAAHDDRQSDKEISVEGRSSLVQLMTPAQIAEGQRRAAAFIPRKEILGSDNYASLENPFVTGSGFFITMMVI